jgi:F420-dependent oxidoreductase-like protein
MRLSYVSSFSKPEHRKNCVEYAKLAEPLGYDGVWVPEAFSSDAFTLLGAIAAHTSRMKLATGIVNVFSRSPAILAQTFATLDELSGGRAIIGLGTSGPIVVQDWHGVKFEKPLTRTREVVEIIRMILAGERVNFDGYFFRLKGFQLLMKPVRPRIPIYLATFKENAVKQTGEIADGWLPTHVSIKHVDAMRAQLAAGAKLSGRNAKDIDMAALTLVVCAEDGDRARALCAEHLAYYIGGMGTFYQELMQSYGYVEETARLVALWKSGDRAGAAKVFTRELLDEFVVAGTADECRAALDARRKAGFEHIVCFPPHSATPDDVRRTLKTLAPNG